MTLEEEIEKTEEDVLRMLAALESVRDERTRQEWLKQAGRFEFTPADPGMSNGQRLGCLMEELGEVARAMLEGENAVNDKHDVDLRKELIQVAALAVAWVEYLDRTKS